MIEYILIRNSAAVRVNSIVPNNIMRFFRRYLRFIFATTEEIATLLIDGLYCVCGESVSSEL